MPVLKLIFTWVLDWAFKRSWPAVMEWANDLYIKLKRILSQKSATEKVEKDVQNQAPRDEDTKKNEQDWINS